MKKYTLTIVVAVVVAAAAFYGGMQYGKSSFSLQNLSAAARQQLLQSFRGSGAAGQGQFQGQGQRVQAGQNGGLLTGDVVSKDNQSITIKTRDGSTHIVFYGSGTSVIKPFPASIGDVAVSSSVMVAGTTNSDGSITAESIQLRN